MFEQLFVSLGALLVGFFPGALFVPVVIDVPRELPPFTQHEAPPPRATILFGGDMMFDRFVRGKTEAAGGNIVFSCLGDLLWRADLVVANLEGPITPFPSMSLGSTVGTPENMTFTFPTTTASLLAEHNIRIVNLGNNHIRNFGREGERMTTEYLSAQGIGYFGDTTTARAEKADILGVPFLFINYNEFGGDAETTLAHIAEARGQSRIPIVYTHWGDEYATTSAPRQRALAHAFIDAGAEIVIGTHPHVIQEHDVYEGKHIYYSLGNFVFDQYWNADVRTGLLLEVAFTKDGVADVQELRTELQRDGRTCLAG